MDKELVFIYRALYKIISCSSPPTVTVNVAVACTNPDMTAYKTCLENEEINIHIWTPIFLALFTSVCRCCRAVQRSKVGAPPPPLALPLIISCIRPCKYTVTIPIAVALCTFSCVFHLGLPSVWNLRCISC